jgi:hypothetical protein
MELVKFLSYFTGLGLALLLAGCATADVEMTDPSFTKSAMGSERMAIGPVVQINGEPLQPHEAEAIRHQLISAIEARRDFINVSLPHTANLISRLGGLGEEAITHSMRSSAKDKGIRYFLITEMTENIVDYTVGQHSEDLTENIVDKCGKVVGQRYLGTKFYATANATRKVAARFKVLDLNTSKTVWVTRSETSEAASCATESLFCFPPPPAYPLPPTVASLGMNLAKAAVKKLPKSDRQTSQKPVVGED